MNPRQSLPYRSLRSSQTDTETVACMQDSLKQFMLVCFFSSLTKPKQLNLNVHTEISPRQSSDVLPLQDLFRRRCMAMTESLGFRASYELLGFEGLELGAWGLGFWGLGLIVYSCDRCSCGGGGGGGGVLGAAVSGFGRGVERCFLRARC